MHLKYKVSEKQKDKHKEEFSENGIYSEKQKSKHKNK